MGAINRYLTALKTFRDDYFTNILILLLHRRTVSLPSYYASIPIMSQTLVIKIGTSSLTREDGRLALAAIAALVEKIVDLRAQGYQIVLVSSGAVGVGAARLGTIEPA